LELQRNMNMIAGVQHLYHPKDLRTLTDWMRSSSCQCLLMLSRSIRVNQINLLILLLIRHLHLITDVQTEKQLPRTPPLHLITIAAMSLQWKR
ncbi:hypothetical protein KI387_012233, partial [Taxus chinensis]